MRHLQRIVAVVVATVVGALPAILVDPYVQHIVTSHPWLAAYVPAASAGVYALYRKARPSTPAPSQLPAAPAAAAPPSAQRATRPTGRRCPPRPSLRRSRVHKCRPT